MKSQRRASERNEPQFPIYIISKGRWESRLTSRALEDMGVPYRIIVEAQERDAYASVIDPKKILVLDPAFQRDYDACCELPDGASRGSGPARNFAWAHAKAAGADRHWIMDDNIKGFFRLNNNLKVPVSDGTVLRCMEDFTLRYTNVGLSGPNYFMFASRKQKAPPFVVNTRLYSCILIRNDLPMRWRARYNEDVDLSLRVLKAGWATIQFNAFLQYKMPTQSMKGGNTDELYAGEGKEHGEKYARGGTVDKSTMLRDLHPDVTRLVIRFGRHHHYVDYSRFKTIKLRRREGLEIPDAVDDYGMRLETVR